jgi:hypothetical protein
MNDCANAEMRDRLPDVLHERLEPTVRAAVMAHVEGCADCREELELLRGVHAMLGKAAPRVDVGRIVEALPRQRPVRSRWMDWRVAAAAVVIVVGGTSATLMTRRGERLRPDTAAVVATTETPKAPAPVAVPDRQPASPRVDSQPSRAQQIAARNSEVAVDRGIEMTGGLGDLTEDELRLLLKEIDELEAVPLSDPEPAVIPVTSKRRASPMGT